MRSDADSVGKGAMSIGSGRLIGMAVAFVLLMLLTRRGEQEVGEFRSLATFLLIAESLPLLGMHRWLATQMGTEVHRRGLHIASSLVWAAVVALAIAAVYVAIAISGVYDLKVSHGLLWVASATVPSSALLVEQTALIGIGRSGKVGLLNLGENVFRSAIGIVLVIAGADVLSVVAMFALVRWATAAIGFRMLRAEVGALDWRRPFAELYGLRGVVPRFAGVMVCFLTMRNAALVMLPSLAGTAQTGRFAVSYQLADLAMLIPTVLALSSTFAMARGAASSLPHLRRTMVSMVALLSVVSFPIAALAIALAEPVLALLFGPRLLAAAIPLQLMMLATPLMAVDQVLSQGMVSDQRYSEDLIAIAVGAVAAVALTAVGAMLWGAVGAAAAFLVALLLSLMTRAWLMRDLRLFKVFFRAAWRSAIASLLCCALTWWAAATLLRSVDPRWALLWAVPGLAVYAACLAAAGGARPRSRRRMLDFVRRRN